MNGSRRVVARSKRIEQPGRYLRVRMLKKLRRALVIDHRIESQKVMLGQLGSAIKREIPNGVVPNGRVEQRIGFVVRNALILLVTTSRDFYKPHFPG